MGFERFDGMVRERANSLHSRRGIIYNETTVVWRVGDGGRAPAYVPALEVKLPREAPNRVPLNLEDVRVLRAFLKGADRYADSYDNEHPLSSELGRLRHLLLGEPRPRDEGDEE